MGLLVSHHDDWAARTSNPADFAGVLDFKAASEIGADLSPAARARRLPGAGRGEVAARRRRAPTRFLRAPRKLDQAGGLAGGHLSKMAEKACVFSRLRFPLPLPPQFR